MASWSAATQQTGLEAARAIPTDFSELNVGMAASTHLHTTTNSGSNNATAPKSPLTLPSMNGGSPESGAGAHPTSPTPRRSSPVSNRLSISHMRSMRRAISVPNLDSKDEGAQDDDANGSGSDAEQSTDSEMNHKKRNRTTPEQLAILEEMFSKNPIPNLQIRDALAEKLDMSPRSVQIWFQNRRAKLKLQDKKNMLKAEQMMSMYPFGPGLRLPLSTGGFDPRYSHSSPYYSAGAGAGSEASGRMRSASAGSGYLSNALRKSAIDPSLTAVSLPSPTGFPALPLTAIPNPAMRVIFEADRLKIGTWTRLTLSHGDLVCKFDGTLKIMSWEIVEGPHRCKIEFPFQNVSHLTLHIVNDAVAILQLQLLRVPLFFLEVKLSDNRSVWRACNDITEGQQASRESAHTIQASKAVLTKQLPRLIENDAHLRSVSRVKDETSVVGVHRTFPQELGTDSASSSSDLAAKTMRKSQSTPVLPHKAVFHVNSPDSDVTPVLPPDLGVSSSSFGMHQVDANNDQHVDIEQENNFMPEQELFPDYVASDAEMLTNDSQLEPLPMSAVQIDGSSYLANSESDVDSMFDSRDMYIPRTSTL